MDNVHENNSRPIGQQLGDTKDVWLVVNGGESPYVRIRLLFHEE